MLSDFVARNRAVIISGTRARVARRSPSAPNELELENGIPLFLDQLAEALRLKETSDATDNEQISRSAGRHGHELLRMGLTIGQVVHDYGDVCQTITALAVEQKVPISTEDFQTLNLCLDDAIAEAVTEFSRVRESKIAAEETERLGFLAHEQRNLLNAAMLAYEMIKTGRVAVAGSTGQVLGRSLLGLRDLVDRSLTDVRLDAGIERLELICVAELVDEIEIGASLQAQVRRLSFAASSVDRTVTVEGDRQIISAAVSNLLQNAFKFTHRDGAVSLTASATAEHVLFEIEDQCGGLPPGSIAGLFRPFEQRGTDRSGVGLGLAICLKAARANRGEIRVRDLPGRGCVFTLELPRTSPRPRGPSGPHPTVRGLP